MSPPTDPNLRLVTEPHDPEAVAALADELHRERMAKRTDREVLDAIEAKLAACQTCSEARIANLETLMLNFGTRLTRIYWAAFVKPAFWVLASAVLGGALAETTYRLIPLLAK